MSGKSEFMPNAARAPFETVVRRRPPWHILTDALAAVDLNWTWFSDRYGRDRRLASARRSSARRTLCGGSPSRTTERRT